VCWQVVELVQNMQGRETELPRGRRSTYEKQAPRMLSCSLCKRRMYGSDIRVGSLAGNAVELTGDRMHVWTT
jgi:hypothetical protein